MDKKLIVILNYHAKFFKKHFFRLLHLDNEDLSGKVFYWSSNFHDFFVLVLVKFLFLNFFWQRPLYIKLSCDMIWFQALRICFSPSINNLPDELPLWDTSERTWKSNGALQKFLALFVNLLNTHNRTSWKHFTLIILDVVFLLSSDYDVCQIVCTCTSLSFHWSLNSPQSNHTPTFSTLSPMSPNSPSHSSHLHTPQSGEKTINYIFQSSSFQINFW